MKRYALIGSGMMGQEHLKNLALLSGVEVTHVYEPDVMMQARTRALVPEVTFCQDIGALLAAAPDAIVIASPNYCHAEQLAEIAASGRVPVLVEKPVCVNHAQLQQVASIAANQPWWVAMEYRYMPPIAKLIEIVRSGAVGRRRQGCQSGACAGSEGAGSVGMVGRPGGRRVHGDGINLLPASAWHARARLGVKRVLGLGVGGECEPRDTVRIYLCGCDVRAGFGDHHVPTGDWRLQSRRGV